MAENTSGETTVYLVGSGIALLASAFRYRQESFARLQGTS